jgi:hypothetical protein
MGTWVRAPCGDVGCRASRLTIYQFEQVGAERWTQSFRSRLGKRATGLHVQVYGKKPRRVRAHPHRNPLRLYPCGILVQAYGELKNGERATYGDQCRASEQSVWTFALRLAGGWTRSFRVRLGQLASKMYRQIYGKKPPVAADSDRRPAPKYPRGILEQACRELNAQGAAPAGAEHEAHRGSG